MPGWKASTLALGPLLTFGSPPNSLPNLHCFNEGTKYAPLMWWVVRVWCRWGLTGGLSSRREGGGAATSKAQLTTEYTLRPPLRRLPCPHHCQCCFTFWPDFCSHSRHCHFQPIAHQDCWVGFTSSRCSSAAALLAALASHCITRRQQWAGIGTGGGVV